MTGSGAGQLLVTLLSLHLDPACNLLGVDLGVSLFASLMHEGSLNLAGWL